MNRYILPKILPHKALIPLLIITGLAWAGRSIIFPSEEARTIPAAMIVAKVGDTILVSDGVYQGPFSIEPGVVFKASNQYGAILDGRGKLIVVSMGRRSQVLGFEIRNGTIGVFSKHAGNVIRGCRIVNNWQTGIVCVRQLPVIEDNIIAFNGGSGIQGWDLLSAQNVSINHNDIAFNANHGIAFGGKADVTVAQNIIVFNERFGIKTRSSEEHVNVTGNNLFGNLWSLTPTPSGNFSYDPKFGSSAGMNFTVGQVLPCQAPCAENNPGVRDQRIGKSKGSQSW